jgi:hypothetical protein
MGCEQRRVPARVQCAAAAAAAAEVGAADVEAAARALGQTAGRPDAAARLARRCACGDPAARARLAELAALFPGLRTDAGRRAAARRFAGAALAARDEVEAARRVLLGLPADAPLGMADDGARRLLASIVQYPRLTPELLWGLLARMLLAGRRAAGRARAEGAAMAGDLLEAARLGQLVLNAVRMADAGGRGPDSELFRPLMVAARCCRWRALGIPVELPVEPREAAVLAATGLATDVVDVIRRARAEAKAQTMAQAQTQGMAWGEGMGDGQPVMAGMRRPAGAFMRDRRGRLRPLRAHPLVD